MKRVVLGLLLVVGILPSFAQKKQKITVPLISDVQVDAVLGEWDSLHNVADEGLWFYQLGQDADNLYVALRIEDKALQVAAVLHGIAFNILPNKKKKEDILFLFPYLDNETKRAMLQQGETLGLEKEDDWMERSRGYLVYGFPTVPKGLLSLQNSYGLYATVRPHQEKLYYEVVIPKVLLDYTQPVARIKLSIHDGFSPLLSTQKQPNARAGGMYGTYRYRGPARSKDNRTTAVLLETKID